jgi:hypothetical protein
MMPETWFKFYCPQKDIRSDQKTGHGNLLVDTHKRETLTNSGLAEPNV